MAHFPPVSGRNIDGQKFNLPSDFGHKFSIAILAYTQRQQRDVDTWIPPLREFEANHSNVGVYELPAIEGLNWIMQKQVDFWMSNGISDPTARATTITLYTDLAPLLGPLNLPGTQEIGLVLVERDGTVHWTDTGRYDDQKFNHLTNALDGLLIQQ